MKKLIILFIFLVALPADGDEMFPKKDWFAKPNPMASPDAVIGGEISVFLNSEKTSDPDYRTLQPRGYDSENRS